MARQAVAETRRAVGALRHVKTQRRLDAGGDARTQHAHGEMRVEDHDHPVAGDGDADRLGAAGGADVADDAHLVGPDGFGQFLHVDGEGLSGVENPRPRQGHGVFSLRRHGQQHDQDKERSDTHGLSPARWHVSILISEAEHDFGSSSQGWQSLPRNQLQEFQGSSPGLLFSLLPLGNRGLGDVQVSGEYRLTHMLAEPDRLDLFRRVLCDRRQAHGIELAHGRLVHDPGCAQIPCGLMNGFQHAATLDLTHPCTSTL